MRIAVLALFVAACSGTASGPLVGHKHDGGAYGDGGIVLADMAYDTTSCAGGGTDCQTGAPGACNDGIVTCNGTEAMCTMKSSVQSCYDGPASTVGVGVCASGTQSCDGPTLGACEGEILPATKEGCANNADDDCNGTVNDTCPSGDVELTSPRNVSPYVGGNDAAIAGNMDLTVQCPDGAFVTSMVIEFADPHFQMAGVRLGCSTVTLARGTSGYTATLAAVSPSPYGSLIATDGVGTGTPITFDCSGSGLRGVWATKATYDSGGVLGYFAQCGAAAIVQNTDNSLGITMTATTGSGTGGTTDASGFYGYDYGASQMISFTPQTWTCNASEVVVGLKGNVSICGMTSDNQPLSCLDNVQPICATISPRYL